MTPQEAYTYLKANVKLPPGATLIVNKDTIVIGNSDVNFVLRGDLLSSEESSILAVQKSLPHLVTAMQEVAAQKANAAKAEAEAKNLVVKSRQRRKDIMKVKRVAPAAPNKE